MSTTVTIDPKYKIEIIFAGSGGMYPYYFGISEILQQHFDLSDVFFSATSGGCYAPMFLSSNKNIVEYFKKIQDYIFNELEESYTGTFFKLNKIIFDLTKKIFNTNDILKINNKFVCRCSLIKNISNPYSWKAVYFNKWDNVEDFANCIKASSYLPIYGTELLSKYKGNYYADGIFTHNTKESVSNLPSFVFNLDKWRKIPISWYHVYNDYQWGNKLYKMGKEDAIKNLDEIKDFFNKYSSQTYV
jgi:hypothetical protein